MEEKLSGDKISDEDMQGVEKSPSGSENKSVAKPENTAKHCEEISRELIPSRPKIKRPKKLVARKLRR